jgi:hypothetical protein
MPLEAKRAAPKPVPPIDHQGIRFTAPIDDGRRGYIVAFDCRTGEPLWAVTIFRNHVDPDFEFDVQMVYIKGISMDGDSLVISDEWAGVYRLDPTTKKVTQISMRKYKLHR